VRIWQAAALAAALAAVAPAHANDSTAELATGGLVFVKNPAVTMRSERLLISAAEIRVRYVFYNNSARDITNTVGFPMPDIAIEGPDANIALPTENPENLLDFTTTVDGQPVAAQVEQRVFARGVEQTALLRRLGIPLAPHLRATDDALDRLPQPQWQQLIGLGLAAIEEYDVGAGMKKHLVPRWTLKTTYFWQQSFPAGREIVVEHRYKPSRGASVQTSLGEQRWDALAGYQRKYCIDRDFTEAVMRARQAAHSSYGGPFSEERIDYILATGANWAGPIADFALVVDKGSPANLVSFCAEGVRKISPTQFEMHKTNFTPSGDLAVLILKPLPQSR
jgi:hypothetical protein